MCALVTGVQTCALPILVDLTLALSHCSFTTSTSAGNLSGHALKPSDMKAAATNNVTANPYQGPATAKRSERHARKVATTQSARPKATRCAELNCSQRQPTYYGASLASPESSSDRKSTRLNSSD